MSTFVLMTKLTQEVLNDPRGRNAVGKQWLRKVSRLCPSVKWLAHYAILGPYDFMDIYEAPDVETAHKVSLISRMEGALAAESWEAIAYDRFLELVHEVREDQ